MVKEANDNRPEGEPKGGSGHNPAPRREPMPTFGPLYKIRYTIHQIQDVKLPREFTPVQLLAAVAVFLLTWLIAQLVLPGIITVAVAGGAAFVANRAVARAEERGRSPLVEVFRLVSHPFKRRYYVGCRPVAGKPERQRLAAITNTEISSSEERREVTDELLALGREVVAELRPHRRRAGEDQAPEDDDGDSVGGHR